MSNAVEDLMGVLDSLVEGVIGKGALRKLMAECPCDRCAKRRGEEESKEPQGGNPELEKWAVEFLRYCEKHPMKFVNWFSAYIELNKEAGKVLASREIGGTSATLGLALAGLKDVVAMQALTKADPEGWKAVEVYREALRPKKAEGRAS